MYAILVMLLHYPPLYVLDLMQMYEALVAMKYGYYAYKDIWEAGRLNAYMTALVNSTRRLDMTEMLPFPWEEKEEEKSDSITKEDIERLKKQAEEYIKHKNN